MCCIEKESGTLVFKRLNSRVHLKINMSKIRSLILKLHLNEYNNRSFFAAVLLINILVKHVSFKKM